MTKLKPRALGTSAVVASFQALMCEPGNEVSVVESSNCLAIAKPHWKRFDRFDPRAFISAKHQTSLPDTNVQ